MTSRFLQIHSLHSYTAVLLNRDDTGFAKRLPYGGVARTRISSQCLKRHWRMADDPHALHRIEGATQSLRSRDLVTERVIKPMKDDFSDEVIGAIEPELQKAVYGDKADKDRKSRQILLMGEPELAWLQDQARNLATAANGDAKAAQKAAQEFCKDKDFKANMKAMRAATDLPAGLTAALFGRMVTSDPLANIEAPIHVAHAFTVHEEESDIDFLTAVDDLKGDDEDAGAGTIQDIDLTSGLFYGYVVVDIPGLLANLADDRELAGQVAHNLVHLIAEISPGAKLGSTAPYGRAEVLLVEAGDRQPRSLAGAFRAPARPQLEPALGQMCAHLETMDRLYETGETRRALTVTDTTIPGADNVTLKGLADWARETVQSWDAA